MCPQVRDAYLTALRGLLLVSGERLSAPVVSSVGDVLRDLVKQGAGEGPRVQDAWCLVWARAWLSAATWPPDMLSRAMRSACVKQGQSTHCVLCLRCHPLQRTYWGCPCTCMCAHHPCAWRGSKEQAALLRPLMDQLWTS